MNHGAIAPFAATESESAARRVIENSRRAAEVMQTIRGLAVKAATSTYDGQR